MQALDVVERLRALVPQFTDVFSNTVDITSLTATGNTITATATAHGLETGDYITIAGAFEPVDITSITRAGNIITITCTTSHKQYALLNEKRYITIANASPAEYNGSFLLTEIVSDTVLKAKITTTPASPATNAGNLQLASNEYNGYKQITVVDPDTFTYSTNIITPNSPAQGTIKLHILNIKYGANIDIIVDGYDVNNTGTEYKNTIAVVLENSQVYNENNITTTDIAGMYDNMQSTGFRIYEIYPVSIYMFLPNTNTQYLGTLMDLARRLEAVLHKSILSYPFTRKNIGLDDKTTYPANYLGSELFDVNEARYIHKVNYAIKTQLTSEYATDYITSAPLENISGNLNSLVYSVDTR